MLFGVAQQLQLILCILGGFAYCLAIPHILCDFVSLAAASLQINFAEFNFKQ